MIYEYDQICRALVNINPNTGWFQWKRDDENKMSLVEDASCKTGKFYTCEFYLTNFGLTLLVTTNNRSKEVDLKKGAGWNLWKYTALEITNFMLANYPDLKLWWEVNGK